VTELPSSSQSGVDPDLPPLGPQPGRLLAVISIGGVIGAEARYGLGRWITHGPTGFPLSTLLINISGALLLGVLMAVISTRRVPPLTRPFLGVGVLGGYTTFSTFAVDTVGLAHRHHVGLAALYVAATVVASAVAVWVGDSAARLALRREAAR
jgi:CrcB protein